jgi:hypothetical protein
VQPGLVVRESVANPPALPIERVDCDTAKEHELPLDTVNGFETLLREVPFGPVAATLDSYS